MNITDHLLACLAEEGGEVGKECHKAQRFGLDDQVTLDPYGPRGTEGPTNQEKIIMELNDLLGVAMLMVEEEILPPDWQSPARQLAKVAKVKKFMHYARCVGALEDQP